MERMECETGRVALAGGDVPLLHDLRAVEEAPSIARLGQGIDGLDEDFAERLHPLDLEDLFALDLKPRGMVLDPIIPEKGLVMLYGARGAGKTYVALGIAHAVATGSAFLKWRAQAPRRVLLIDGEMPTSDLRERLRQVAAAAEHPATRGMFGVLSADRVKRGIGNLGSPVVQAELDPWLDGVELLILDNLSSLTAGLRENDSDAWSPIQEWLLRLRRRGISVLIVHHAGKRGEQRGTSRREDVLDTSLSLRRPSDYTPAQGARFEVHIEKGRGLHGEDAKPFEARLDLSEGKTAWSIKDVEDAARLRVAALLAAGMSVRDRRGDRHRQIGGAPAEAEDRAGGEGGRGWAGRRRIAEVTALSRVPRAWTRGRRDSVENQGLALSNAPDAADPTFGTWGSQVQILPLASPTAVNVVRLLELLRR
jgi:KaiC/GvpD/RAD55 family RecA-like ATPase